MSRIDGQPVRLLVVAGDVIVRSMVAEALSGHDGVVVVGDAATARVALLRAAELKPDLVILDLGPGAAQALTDLRASWPGVAVVVFSEPSDFTDTTRLLPSDCFVVKPAPGPVRDALRDAIRKQLVPAVVGDGDRPEPRPVSAGPPVAPGQIKAVVIGVSTGGPNTLAKVVPVLPVDLGATVLVVQHMPPGFTKSLAERLDTISPTHVTETTDGMEAMTGITYIAAGGVHLVLERDHDVVRLREDHGPPENSCRPAVDVTLRSAAKLWGPHLLTIILTGMGSDGADGARAVRDAGGTVWVQDEATSVVWGMAGEVVRRGLADAVLPLDDIAPALIARCRAGANLARTS